MRQDIIEKSIARYKEMVAKEPTIEPEDGFIWVLEETDFGEKLADDRYTEYLNAITRGCLGEAIEFEQLPDQVLSEHFGDFAKCEGKWNPMTRDHAIRFLTAMFNTVKLHEGTETAEGLSSVEDAIATMTQVGRVINLPIGYMRAVLNDNQKCPRCGGSIMSDSEKALSRYDNETVICSACGKTEAFEDFFHTVSD